MVGETLPMRRSSEDSNPEIAQKKSKTTASSSMEEVPKNMENANFAPSENMDTTKNENQPNVGPISYKQALANESFENPSNPDEICSDSEDDFEEAEEDEDITCPNIRISEKEKLRLRSKWNQTLIVKVLGRNVGYSFLLKTSLSYLAPKS